MSSADLGTARGRIEIDASGAVRAFSDTEKAAAGFIGGLEKHSRSLDRAGKMLVGIGTAALGGLGVAVKTSANFEQAMNKVAAVSGATGKEFDALREQAKMLGRTTAFSASEAAEAMYFLSSAGFSTAEMLEAMPGVLNLAAAGNLDLATAADIASNVLSGYGFKASDIGRVNDVLAGTFKNANTNISQLGEAMKYVAPVASASGVSFEEAAAAIGKLSDAGIQGGMAGTTLRGIISALEKPTGAAAEAIDRLGIKTHDSAGKLLPLADIVGQLEDAGLSTADAMTIFGQRAGPGMMALVSQGGDALAELTKELENSGGTAEEMANKQLEGLNGALTQLKSALEGAAIGIGDVLLPHVTKFAEILTNLVQRFANLSPRMQAFIAIGTAVGGALSIVAGAALMVLARLPMIIAGVKAMGAALAFVSAGPIALIVAAIAAVAAGLIYAYKNSETFRNIVHGAMEKVKTAVQWVRDAWDKLVQGFKNGGSGIGDSVNRILGPIQTFGGMIRNVADTIRNGFGAAVEWVRETIEMFRPQIEQLQVAVGEMGGKFMELMEVLRPVGQFLMNVMGEAFKAIGVAIQAMWAVAKPVLGFLATLIGDTLRMAISGLVQVFRGAVQIISGILDVFIGLFTGDWRRMWEGIKSIAAGIFNAIVGAVKTWLAVSLFKVIGAGFKAVTALIRGAWNGIRGVFTGALNGIRSGVTSSFNAVRSFIQSVWNGILSFLRGAVTNIRTNITSGFNTIRAYIGTVISAIRSNITTVWNAIRTVISSVVSGIRSIISNAFSAIRSTMSNAASGARNAVTNAFRNMRTAVSNIISNLLNTIRRIPGQILRALGNTSNMLRNAGMNIIKGLISGITSMGGRVKDAVSGVMSKARNLLPFSPAKEGPFSGKGWTLHSGRAIMEALIKGMRDQERVAMSTVHSIAGRLASALSASLAEPALLAIQGGGGATQGVPEGFATRAGVIHQRPPSSTHQRPTQSVVIERIEALDPLAAARIADRELGWAFRTARSS